MKYIPSPHDVGDVQLGAELDALIEFLAENVHEQWALGRINDGWRYGPERDDEQKLHPGLVAYNELSDLEKEYDRNTAVATLKLIKKFGFEITKK